MHVDRAGDAAHEVVRMRVLAAEDGVDLDDFLVEVEHFKVVRNGKEIDGRRQLHGRVAPVAVLEDGKLAAFDEFLQTRLYVTEVACGRQMVMRADLLLNFARFARIGRQSAHHVDPVQSRELIEVHQMVLYVQGCIHQVADDVGVLRDLDADGVFDGAHGCKRVNAGADAADAFDERPGVARIAPLENHFETAPHRAGAHRVGDDAVGVDFCLHAQMTFDAGDGVNDNAAGVLAVAHSLPPMSLLVLARAWATALMAACAAAATPTTATVAMPTLSTVASTPPQPGGRMSGSWL